MIESQKKIVNCIRGLVAPYADKIKRNFGLDVAALSITGLKDGKPVEAISFALFGEKPQEKPSKPAGKLKEKDAG